MKKHLLGILVGILLFSQYALATNHNGTRQSMIELGLADRVVATGKVCCLPCCREMPVTLRQVGSGVIRLGDTLGDVDEELKDVANAGLRTGEAMLQIIQDIGIPCDPLKKVLRQLRGHWQGIVAIMEKDTITAQDGVKRTVVDVRTEITKDLMSDDTAMTFAYILSGVTQPCG